MSAPPPAPNIPNFTAEVWRDYDGVIAGGYARADHLHVAWAHHSNVLHGSAKDGILVKEIIDLAIYRWRQILDGQPDDVIVQKLIEVRDAIPAQHG